MKFPKSMGPAGLAFVVRGVVAALPQVADATDTLESDWKKKRRTAGIEIAFMGGSIRGALKDPRQVVGLGVGQQVSAFCTIRTFKEQHSPDLVILIEKDGKPIEGVELA